MSISKLKAMLSSFFSKSENDLEGYHFKKLFESTPGAQLVDVRTSAEVASGALPKSINIDFMSADFESRVKKLSPNKTYFVYCRSGGRSSGAVKQMKKHGLRAYNLVGGIGAWPK
ncbi:MAG TPA: rhodanese-like domain-containing protein [Mucilaginibacter sp.]|jgi:rhodanese-related sulfurtransferase|nr:rhodanese-like domain-containing protein [Mucilaginibacter sp.]